MGQYAELGKYKNKICERLYTNNNIVKAIVNTETDFLNQPLPDNFDTSSLVRTKIFPYRPLPSIITGQNVFITMSFSIKYLDNEFNSGRVTFYVIVHKDLERTDYDGLIRYDYILDQIDSLFNKKYGIGSFNLVLTDGGDTAPVGENYLTSAVSYEFTDFSR